MTEPYMSEWHVAKEKKIRQHVIENRNNTKKKSRTVGKKRPAGDSSLERSKKSNTIKGKVETIKVEDIKHNQTQ